MSAELESLEISMQDAKETIGLLKSLQKLEKNKDFNNLITTGYFVKEASNLVLLKADPNMQADDRQKNLDNAITAVGHFRQYLGSIYQMGQVAQRSLAADEVTREELLAEEA